jgi:hypothetical protein
MLLVLEEYRKGNIYWSSAVGEGEASSSSKTA